MHLSSETYTYVEKSWGNETWICNSPLYCGKILTILKDKFCSFHFHRLKNEVLYIETGLIKFRYAPLGSQNINEVELGPGEAWHVEPLLVHQMYAVEETRIIEFSTQHFDTDSYRVTKEAVLPGPFDVVES